MGGFWCVCLFGVGGFLCVCVSFCLVGFFVGLFFWVFFVGAFLIQKERNKEKKILL